MVTLVSRSMALVLVSAGLGFAVNGLRPDGVRLTRYEAPTSCVDPAAAPATVEVLPPDRVTTLCGDPGVVVADARPAERFASGHVAGAIHLPCAASGTEATRALDLLVGKHTLVVYGDATQDARPVADEVRRRALQPGLRVVVLEGGFAAWDAAGLACTSGPCPACSESAHR